MIFLTSNHSAPEAQNAFLLDQLLLVVPDPVELVVVGIEVDELKSTVWFDVEGMVALSNDLDQITLVSLKLVMVSLVTEGVVLLSTLTTEAISQNDVELVLVVPVLDLLGIRNPLKELLEGRRRLQPFSLTGTETVPVVVILMTISAVTVWFIAVAVRHEGLRNQVHLVEYRIG